MKINKNIMLIVGILLIGIVVGAGLSTITLEKVIYEKPTPTSISQDEITFDCDAKRTTKEIYENDGKYDENDIKKYLDTYCDGEVTNIQMDGKYWQTNSYGDESFDEVELKILECQKRGMQYDAKLNECIEVIDIIPTTIGDTE